MPTPPAPAGHPWSGGVKYARWPRRRMPRDPALQPAPGSNAQFSDCSIRSSIICVFGAKLSRLCGPVPPASAEDGSSSSLGLSRVPRWSRPGAGLAFGCRAADRSTLAPRRDTFGNSVPPVRTGSRLRLLHRLIDGRQMHVAVLIAPGRAACAAPPLLLQELGFTLGSPAGSRLCRSGVIAAGAARETAACS